MIAEDEDTLRKVLTVNFAEESFRVLSAQNGQEGLDLALKEKPDIILLDRLMPVMDGMAMMKKLRSSGSWGKSVPIVFLTNLAADNEIKAMMSDAGDKLLDYIVKSDLTLSEIVKKVAEKL